MGPENMAKRILSARDTGSRHFWTFDPPESSVLDGVVNATRDLRGWFGQWHVSRSRHLPLCVTHLAVGVAIATHTHTLEGGNCQGCRDRDTQVTLGGEEILEEDFVLGTSPFTHTAGSLHQQIPDAVVGVMG